MLLKRPFPFWLKIASLLALLYFGNTSSAQIFKGGNGDGQALSRINNASSLFFGGNGDGFSQEITANSSNLFKGSGGDGFALASSNNTKNLYAGGNGDGFSRATSESSFSVFSGGNGDGFALAASPTSMNLFAGGNGDGFSLAENTSTNNAFTGGSGDGFSLAKSSNSSQLFAGGAGQGFVLAKAISSSNLFSGGSGQGHTVNNLSNSNSLFKGGIGQGFTFAFFSTESALPIEWVYFNAHRESTDVLLSWAAIETNNDYYELYRSLGTVADFSYVTNIAGSGTTVEEVHYEYTDTNTFQGISYYKLKQVDFDGQFDFSEVVAVVNNADALTDISYYPNPVQDKLNVRMTGVLDCMAELLNIQGLVVREKSVINKDRFQIDTRGLSSGIYILRLLFNGETFGTRIIIE